MAAQKQHAKRNDSDTWGLKALIGVLALAATLGGWASLASQGQAEQVNSSAGANTVSGSESDASLSTLRKVAAPQTRQPAPVTTTSSSR